MSSGLNAPGVRRARSSDCDSHVGRVFAILKAIRETRPPVTLSGIVRRTGLPKSTVHRLLAELHAYEAVSRTGDCYELGRATRQLALPRADDRTKRLRRAIKPLLMRLHVRTRYLVGLGVPGESTVEFLDMVYGAEYCGLVGQIEEASDLRTSAAGKALLAYDPDLVVSLTVRLGWCAGNPRAAGLPAGLSAELSEVRRNGVAVNQEEACPGITEMAVPLFGTGERPIAALCFGAYRHRFDPPGAYGLLRWASLHAHNVLRQDVPATGHRLDTRL